MAFFKSDKTPSLAAIAKSTKEKMVLLGCLCIVFVAAGLVISTKLLAVTYDSKASAKGETDIKSETESAAPLPIIPVPVFDPVAYDAKMLALANRPLPPAPKVVPTPAPATGTTGAVAPVVQTTPAPAKPVAPVKAPLWPAKTVYPKVGALLPDNRIVAYYGNFYSKGMGALGQYPVDDMEKRLTAEVTKWQLADPTTHVIPAIDYIAVTAQGSPSVGGKYRLRMPPDQINKAIEIADKMHGIVILEIQPGQSNFQTEVPLLEEYLKQPQVHLALDPEFTMKGGAKPGSVIGTVDAVDINFTANYLASLVQKYNLPPKILIVHRFTGAMVTNTKNITPLPEVQIVMDMDGWGSPAKKIGTYNSVIYPYPVEFTGFKLFYKNDILPPSTRMLTTDEILKLQPAPSFIQYQ